MKKIIIQFIAIAITIIGSRVVAIPIYAEEISSYGYIQEVTGWQRYTAYGYKYDSPNTGWAQDGNRWRFLRLDEAVKSTVIPINGRSYAFTEDGYMLTGWYSGSISNTDPRTGKPSAAGDYDELGRRFGNNRRGYFGTDGSGVVGWNLIDGNWYYFDEASIVMTNAVTPDGYYIGNDGVWTEESQRKMNNLEAERRQDEEDSNKSKEEKLEQLIELTNQEREKRGLAALDIDDELMDLADIRAEEIEAKFSHTRPDGTDINRYGVGENIMCSGDTAKFAFNGWMDSKGHRENMLRKSYSRIGVGYYKADNAVSANWVMLFQ